jgi:uncharacterized protein with von Willebrand factor type A (vWA) domain
VKRDHDRVYGIDPWTRYMWNNRVRSAPDVERVLSRGVERFETFGAFGREVFGRLFGMRPIPVHPVRPEDRIWERAHAELDELPGWEHLVRRATGDRVLGAAATVAFCDRLLDSLPEPQAQLADVEPMRERARALMRMAEGGAPEGVDVEEMLEALRGQGQAAVEAAQGYAQSVDDSALRQALRASVEAGHAAAAELDCAVGAFSGWQPGASGLGVDIEAKARLAERIRQSPKLQQLARAAGRMRRLALAKQQSPSKHAREEVADVELGSDLARVLPTELVKLTDPLLSLDFARRFVEGTLMQYRLQGRETLGRGPLIVLLDDSGSMEGDRELWAKAVTLGLVQVAAFQRRRCRIVHFDGAVRRVDEWGPTSVDVEALLSSMEAFFGGGTNFVAPMRSAIEAVADDTRLGEADVVLITDGHAEVADEDLARIRASCRARGITVYGLHVGDEPVSAALRGLADEVLEARDLMSDGDEAAGRLFSSL